MVTLPAMFERETTVLPTNAFDNSGEFQSFAAEFQSTK